MQPPDPKELKGRSPEAAGDRSKHESESIDGRQPSSRPRASVAAPPSPSSGDQVLLIGGSVRAAAESARRAGYAPVAVDGFGDRETLVACDAWHPIDAFCGGSGNPREREDAQTPGDTGGQDCFAKAVSPETPVIIGGGLVSGFRWLESCPRRFLTATPRQIRSLQSLPILRRIAHEAGARFPQTVSRTDAFAPSSSGRWGRWLTKNAVSCGGLGVRWHDHANPQPDRDGASYIQAYVSGRLVGASYLTDGERSLCLGTCRLLRTRIGDRPFVFAGAFGPIELPSDLQSRIEALGSAVVRQCRQDPKIGPIRGPFNIDLIVNQGRVTMLEVNARWSGSMELVERTWSESLDLPCSLFDPVDLWLERLRTYPKCSHDYTLKRICFARRRLRFDPSRFESLTVPNAHLTDTPGGPTSFDPGEPVATLITKVRRNRVGCDLRSVRPLRRRIATPELCQHFGNVGSR
ncbi:ATP-grasp domain-containing protein [Roseiconus nitratireducens]|uniref:ATP-grasp domain-containing protein n=1 Tax=Roseiconus nitratireducens TaxID=2605748 RepID=A0A5M6DKL2_9BACT|nr:ATP-grasp domain-containing protein [Roseiconus nitratireducens]KAA5546916.1 ATP-grasp domain-containing protein [Roseiconus nitratireducens]